MKMKVKKIVESKRSIQKVLEKLINTNIKIIILILELLLPIASFIFLILAFTIYIFNEPVFNLRIFYKLLKFDEYLKYIVFYNKAPLLINVSVVLIGFFITVMSVIGVNQSRAVVYLSKENITNKFIRYASYSLGLSFIFLLITIVNSDYLTNGKSLFHFSLFIALIVNAIRFSVIVMMIFKKNMDFAEEDSNDVQIHQKELLRTLKDIQGSVSKVNYNSEEYLNNLRERIEKNRKDESK